MHRGGTSGSVFYAPVVRKACIHGFSSRYHGCRSAGHAVWMDGQFPYGHRRAIFKIKITMNVLRELILNGVRGSKMLRGKFQIRKSLLLTGIGLIALLILAAP